MRPRFSIRTLLILTGVVATACWWIVRPSIVAQRFVAAIDQNNFASIDAMWSGPKLVDIYRIESLNSGQMDWRIRALPERRTWHDLWQGVRRIHFELRNEKLDQTRSGPVTFPPIIATPFGIHPDPAHKKNGSSGIAI